MEEYINPHKLLSLIQSRTFFSLSYQNQNKTPMWRLHFKNVRFAGMRLSEVVEEAYSCYDHINNIVRQK